MPVPHPKSRMRGARPCRRPPAPRRPPHRIKKTPFMLVAESRRVGGGTKVSHRVDVCHPVLVMNHQAVVTCSAWKVLMQAEMAASYLHEIPASKLKTASRGGLCQSDAPFINFPSNGRSRDLLGWRGALILTPSPHPSAQYSLHSDPMSKGGFTCGSCLRRQAWGGSTPEGRPMPARRPT